MSRAPSNFDDMVKDTHTHTHGPSCFILRSRIDFQAAVHCLEALKNALGEKHQHAVNVYVAFLSPQVISSGSEWEKLAGYSRAVRVGKHVQVLYRPWDTNAK